MLPEYHQVVEPAAEFLERRPVAPEDVMGHSVLRRHQEYGADAQGVSLEVRGVQVGLPARQFVQVVAVGVAHLLVACVGHQSALPLCGVILAVIVELDKDTVGVVDEDTADPAVGGGESLQRRGQLNALAHQFVSECLTSGTVNEMWLMPTWSSLMASPSGSSPGWHVSTREGAVLPGP